MARLDGYHESNTSQSSLITTNYSGTRIAAASWKTVTIWVLNPNALIDGNEDGFYPESWNSPMNGVTELPPVVVDLGAVCSQIQFTEDSNELIAITDRGLMILDLRPDGKGVEVVQDCRGFTERTPIEKQRLNEKKRRMAKENACE